MEEKDLVCNDCGCRFELQELRKVEPKGREKDETPEIKMGPTDLWCPKCRSFNVTTA